MGTHTHTPTRHGGGGGLLTKQRRTLKLVSLQEVQILRVLGVLEWGEGIFPCLGLVSFIEGKEAATLTILGKCVLV